MLELPNNFKIEIIKMLQQKVMNTLEKILIDIHSKVIVSAKKQKL